MAKTKQDYGTPRGLFNAANEAFGPFDMDGAAHADNHLLRRWTSNATLWTWKGNVFVNPPFSMMPYFAELCYLHSDIGRNQSRDSPNTVVLLCRLDPTTRWWQTWVHKKAKAYILKDRVMFVGGHIPYVYPCCLVVYGRGAQPEFQYFNHWRRSK